MDVQWPLVFFTLFTGLGVGAFSCVAVTEWLGLAESIRMPGAVTALAAMALGGGFSVLHLSHPFRTYHIPRHLSTGVGKEMLLIGLTGLSVLLYILMLSMGFADAARILIASLGLIFGIALAFELGAIYLLPARPAWNTWFWPFIYAASAAAAGLFAMTIWAAVLIDRAGEAVLMSIHKAALISLITLAGSILAYGIFLGGAPYKEAGRSPRRLLAGDMALSFWAGVVFSGLAVPIGITAYVQSAKEPHFWLMAGVIGLLGTLIGGVSIRALMYRLGSEADPVLGGVAALGAAAKAVSLFKGRRQPFEPIPEPMTGQKVEWKANFCSGCHQPVCAMKVKVVDGVVTEVEGDPKSPTNQGTLCPRGIALPMNLYNPYRVKAPLRRTNPNRSLDEDPGWVEISWEEALNAAGERLRKARETDPRSILYYTGFGFEESRVRWADFLDSPNSLFTMGPLCPEHFSGLHMSGTMLDRLDVERCNYVVLAGRTFGGGFGISGSSTRNLAKAVERGMHIVCIDPRFNREAQFGEWVPIRPGTHAALAAAFVHCILHEIKRYDTWWLKVRSNGPYLIPAAVQIMGGSRVFMEDYVRDPDTGKPLVWDEERQGPVPFDHSKGETYALEGGYEVNGQAVKTCLQALKDYVIGFTPEWASEITTIPAAKIREIAGNLVREARIGEKIHIDGYEFPYSPACIDIGRGAVTDGLGTQTYKFYCAANVLLGNTDVPGGMQGCQTMSQRPFLSADRDGILKARFEMSEQVTGVPFQFPPKGLAPDWLYPTGQSFTPMVHSIILEPEKWHVDFPPKVALVHAANPFASNANPDEVIKAWQKIPFVVSIAYHFDEPTQLADIVLPEDSSLERINFYRMRRNEKECTDENRGLWGTLVKRPAVKRVYNTRNCNDIMIELAKRCGALPNLYREWNEKGIDNMDPLGPEWPRGLAEPYKLDPHGVYTWEEFVQRKLKSDFGPQAGLDDFKECAFRPHRLPTVKETYNYYYAPENSIRQPLYFQSQAEIGRRLKENLERIGVKPPGYESVDELVRNYSGFGLWFEPADYGTTAEHPFKVINWKIHFMTTGNQDYVGNPWLQEILDDAAPEVKSILIHPVAAGRERLREGDEIVVESQWGGKTEGRVHITHLIHPEALGIGGSFGRKGLHRNPRSWEGPSFNVLLSAHPPAIDPVSVALCNSPRVKVYKKT